MACLCTIPYSEKFSLVQTFAELFVNPLEEISVVLIFTSVSAIATCSPRYSILYAYVVRVLCDMMSLFHHLFKNFAVLICAEADQSAKNAKACTMRIGDPHLAQRLNIFYAGTVPLSRGNTVFPQNLAAPRNPATLKNVVHVSVNSMIPTNTTTEILLHGKGSLATYVHIIYYALY